MYLNAFSTCGTCWKKCVNATLFFVGKQRRVELKYVGNDILSINNPDFENYMGQIYPAEREIKDTTESPCFLLGFTPVDREWRSTAHFPFQKKVTISTSISQTFRSSLAIFHLRQPMMFYLKAHTVCQGLLLLWMFYSKGGATFN